jgi:uncharacterized membrane protein
LTDGHTATRKHRILDDVVEDPAAVLSWRRAAVALAAGAVGGVLTGLAGALELAPIVSWIVATSVVLVWVWRIIWPQDPAGTERLAECEARSRTTDTGVLGASAVSLGAIALAVVQSSDADAPAATAAVLLCLPAAVLSWALVNTVFALKYARLYYLDEDGGIEFKENDPPAYSDFAYMAFTVGMSYAVADTDPTDAQGRKIVLGHALLSYVFGTGILAVAINLVTNLGQS